MNYDRVFIAVLVLGLVAGAIYFNDWLVNACL
jgi:hypothetical protein